MDKSYEPSSTDAGLRAVQYRPRTVYHFTSIIAGVAWLAAISYAIKVFHEAGASIAQPYYFNAVQSSVVVSLMVWFAFVRTWADDSRRMCIVFTIALIGLQVAAIFTVG